MSKTKKKILCFTGTRADYGIYRPLLFEIEKSSCFELQLVVTGMHVLEEYGVTINEVRKDPFYILSTPSILVKGDTRGAMSKATGLLLYILPILLNKRNPMLFLF